MPQDDHAGVKALLAEYITDDAQLDQLIRHLTNMSAKQKAQFPADFTHDYLKSVDQKKSAARQVVDDLPTDEAKTQVAVYIMSRLSLPEHQKAAAQKVIRVLPDETRAEVALQTLRSLDSAERRQTTAQTMVYELNDDAKTHLATQALRAVESPERKQAAAQTVAHELNDDAKADVAAETARSVQSPERRQDTAQRIVEDLPDKQREEVAEGLSSLDEKTRNRIWVFVVRALATIVFVFGLMAFVLTFQKKGGAEAPLTLSTTALGAIIGIIASNPNRRRSL